MRRMRSTLLLLALLPWPAGGAWGQETGEVAASDTTAADTTEAAAPDPASCLQCHGDASMMEGMGEGLVVDTVAWSASIHAEAGFDCLSCHPDATVPHTGAMQTFGCSDCHSDVGTEFETSIHGYALSRGNPRAPSCSSCHGVHDVLPSSNPRSPTHQVRLPNTCAECHGDAGLLTDQIVKLPQSFTDYAESVHGQGAGRGIAAAASCADCHSVHDLRGAADPASKINVRNVASTCGQCHPDIQLEYDESIHGRALAAGVTDSPTCTDCHGEHLILSPRDPDADTYAARMAEETCGECHNEPVIIAKYNLEGGVVESYEDSYHGWAARRGYERAATCVACHSTHRVLPASDSSSTIHPANVVSTCRQCHPEADARFAASYTHENASLATNPLNRAIRLIYLILIGVVIGGMVLHNVVIMNYYLVQARRKQLGARWVMRFDRAQIFQHLLLSLAFTVLVITGFALRYPDAWWVEWLAAAGMDEPLRGDLHRISAVLLIVVALHHVWYLFFTERGREEFRAILPRWSDVTDLVRNLRYHTWGTDRKVKFGRYDYSQKAEYWALIWGTVLMVITGFVLWFPGEAVSIFPVWIVTASQAVHFYEAWLATLAILVWHFFFVIFHPEEYPMSWTWLTGKMSEESVREHHAGWWEEEIAPKLGEKATAETEMAGAGVGEGRGPIPK